MMKRLAIRRWVVVLAVVILLLLSAACSRPERTIKISDDWSRGQRLGFASLLQPTALAVEPDGQRVHVAWSGRQAEGEDTELTYAQLDGEGTTRVQQVLPFLFLPRQPHLALAADEHVHLFALARRDAASPDGVFYMLLDANGMPQGEGWQLSSPEQATLNYEAVGHSDGSVDVFWAQEGGETTALYHQRLGPDGSPQTNPLRVTEGQEPTAQIDRQGTLHLAWLAPTAGRDRRLYYAAFPQGQVTATTGVAVGITPAEGVGIQRPLVLGLDERQVYLIWSVEWRSGLSAGSAEAPYVHFPLGRPQDARSGKLGVPEDAEAYDTLAGPMREAHAYRLQNLLLALPGSMGRLSGFLEAPRAVPGQREELAIVVSSQVQFRRSDDSQLVLALFKDGQMVGYQMVGRTTSFSQWPVAVADGSGHLHLVWIDYDSPTEHGVYYASTAPAVQAHLNSRTRQDVLLGAAQAVWGVLSGLSLLPLAIILMVPLVIWCGLFYIFGSDDSLSERGPLIGFIIGLVIYFLSKLMVMAPMLMVPPGLGLIPTWLRGAWPVLVLIIVAAVAGLIFWRFYWRRVERPALFSAALWFALTDALLTVLLYGIPFFGD